MLDIIKTARDLDKWPDAEYKRFKNKMYWYAYRDGVLTMRIVSTSHAYEISSRKDLEMSFMKHRPDIIRFALECESKLIGVTPCDVFFTITQQVLEDMNLKIKFQNGKFQTKISDTIYTIEQRNNNFFLETTW